MHRTRQPGGRESEPLRSAYGIYLLIGAPAVFFMGALAFAFLCAGRAQDVYGVQAEAAAEVRVAVVSARLAAEGPAPSREAVRSLLAQADGDLAALLDGGTAAGRAVRPITEPDLRAGAARARILLTQFRAITGRLLAGEAAVRPGLGLDRQMDHVAGRLEALTGDLHTEFLGRAAGALGEFRGATLLLLAASVLVTGGALVGVRRLERGRRADRAALVREVEERRAAETELRTSKAYTDLVFQQMPVVAWTTDKDLRFTSSQGAGLALLGLKDGFVTGMSLFEFFQTEDPSLDPIDATVRALKGERTSYRFEHGGTVWDSFVEPLRDAEGNPVGTVGLALDDTRRHRAEQALRQREEELRRTQRLEAMGTLAGGVAHDFNNLLAAMMTCAEAIRLGTGPEDPRHAIASHILETGQRGAGVVRNLMRFARREPVSARVVRPAAVIGEVLTLVRATFDRRIRVEADVPEDLGPIRCDPSQIHQMLTNLCINARDAILDRGGGHLEITARDVDVGPERIPARSSATPGRFLQIAVRDDGGGIPAAIVDRVFDPFFTTKAPGRGSGLGLSTTYGIVEGHGGFILLETLEGAGTTFRVHLPTAPAGAEEEALPEAPPAPEPAPSAGGTVLVAEDEPVLRHTLADHLTSLGYRVLTASDGRETLDQVARHGAELGVLVLDLILPEVAGADVLRRIRGEHPGLKVVVMSGFAAGAAREGLQGLYDAFLAKPCSLSAVAEAVERASGPPA
jgi:signal transduction histidine kinase/CheY-like chemotaxis protein